MTRTVHVAQLDERLENLGSMYMALGVLRNLFRKLLIQLVLAPNLQRPCCIEAWETYKVRVSGTCRPFWGSASTPLWRNLIH